MKNRKGFLIAALIAAAIIIASGVLLFLNGRTEEAVSYPAKTLSNICVYDGKVYCGTNGFFGEEIVQQSNIFTIQDGKVYYVEKVQEAYDSMTDELMEVWCADLDGGNAELLAEDVFLAGAGQERVIGDKLFYGYAYDELHNMKYAYIDLNTKERKEIDSDNIQSILGYDGNFLYYKGYDMENDTAFLGKVNLKSGKDKKLVSFAGTDEEGSVDTVIFKDGNFYCFTMVEKPEGYDYRTFRYEMQIRSGKTGKMERSLPFQFTGSSNYSFLIEGGFLYASCAGEIIRLPLDGSSGDKEVITEMREDEYWGILYFVDKEGNLYYESIAEVDEKTGFNDYFYRVPADGGRKELLAEWYTP